ncbi:hypothetical protein VTN00DRAFT_6264 [Thermoascus crustaceus]|uniref:uncharacterized protein n=1 Tax=Thermoascus crustaceus TaxID=5088 RepID=UPI003744AE12
MNPRGPRNTLRRRDFPQPISRNRQPSPQEQPSAHAGAEATSSTLRDTNPNQNTLLSPVYIPEDPNAVLKEKHPAAGILANSGLVVQRQLELMNVMLGFEQANKYVIMDASGNHVGYMAEQETGLGNMMARQWFRTHRSFVTHVFDRHENEVLRFHRPFSWINSRIRVYDPLDLADSAYSPSTALQGVSPGSLVSVAGGSNARVSPLGFDDMRIIGEAHSQWAPLRRKYNLFLYHQTPNTETDMGTQRFNIPNADLSRAQKMQLTKASGGDSAAGEFHQFAYVDEPFLSWDFSLRSADNRLIGSVNRNFAGFARELFTDTGVYALRMDAAALAEAEAQQQLPSQTGRYTEKAAGMTLDQRAVMLATAVSIDFDYFSRHSHPGGVGVFPIWIPAGGEAAAGGAAGEAGAAGAGAAGGAAGAAGETAVGEAAAGSVGRAGAGAAGSMAEGAAAGAAGAGTIAGYEAMQRGMAGGSRPPPPDQQRQPDQWQAPTPGEPGADEEIWGEQWEEDDEDFFGRGGGSPWGGGGAQGSSEGEGSDVDWF